MSLSPGHGHFCELPSCDYSHGPIYNLGSNHDQNILRIGHGWYNQQQHILILILYPWDLEVDLHLRYGMVEPPVPSNSINWTRGWICRARSLQNWELMLETWAPESINAVILCPSTVTGASLEHPTKWAMESGFRNRTGAISDHPVLWAAFIVVGFGLGSERECWGPTVDCCGWCQWGVGLHFLGSPQTVLKFWLGGVLPSHKAPTLAPKALERAGVPPVGCALLYIFSSLAILSLVSTCCSPCAMTSRCAVDWGSLSQTSLAIMEAGAARSAPVHLSPPTASLSGAIWGAGWAVALSFPCQGGHQFGNLVPLFCSILHRVCGHGSPSPHFIMGFLVLTFCLAGGNHQLGISGSGVTIEISYGISDVLADPMEEMIFEVLLDL